MRFTTIAVLLLASSSAFAKGPPPGRGKAKTVNAAAMRKHAEEAAAAGEKKGGPPAWANNGDKEKLEEEEKIAEDLDNAATAEEKAIKEFQGLRGPKPKPDGWEGSVSGDGEPSPSSGPSVEDGEVSVKFKLDEETGLMKPEEPKAPRPDHPQYDKKLLQYEAEKLAYKEAEIAYEMEVSLAIPSQALP